jgi:hypothetical protein
MSVSLFSEAKPSSYKSCEAAPAKRIEPAPVAPSSAAVKK